MPGKIRSREACGIFLGESGLSSVCSNFRINSLTPLTQIISYGIQVLEALLGKITFGFATRAD